MRTEAAALLLDTHAWIWLNEGLPELSVERRQCIDDAARRGQARVSIISVWEVSRLHSKQRLHLGASCLDWAKRALAPPLALAALTPEIGRMQWPAGPVPQRPRRRIITATAWIEGLTVVTRDRQILAYAAQGYVSALPC